MNYKIEFEPVGVRGFCPEGTSLMECARQLGVGVANICGGHGKCKACKIQLLSGTVSEPTSVERNIYTAEELCKGWRLACLSYPKSDCKLSFPPESLTTHQRTQVEHEKIIFEIVPVVQTVNIKITEPTLNDLRSDATRLLEELRQNNIFSDHIDIDVLKHLSLTFRERNWETNVSVRHGEIIAVSHFPGSSLGLAVDLGTTKIAGYLLDLASGRTLASKGIMNPQISYGEDVTSRIQYATNSIENALNLKNLAVSVINQLACELCAQTKTQTSEIVDAVIVGNTAMHHLLLGLSVEQLGYSPFVAVLQDSLDVKARDIGLHVAKGAYVHILPNVAGFVGADHVSMLLAINAGNIRETTLAIDIGTNTEVSLICEGHIWAASCASGPAFEGCHISNGMRAAKGAIERLRIVNGEFEYQTIENVPPVGICGSGVIDTLSELYLAGIIAENGRIVADNPHVRQNCGQLEVVIVQEKKGRPAITINQHDIREIQLAKAAIRSGIQILLETAGKVENDIEQVLIAGAFGTYIDVGSAITIGMLPSIPTNLFQQIGNAAGLGAKIALLSQAKREEAERLARRVQYIELSTHTHFTQIYLRSNYLGR
jgi:uncharacterized 2Fe-2S/4Fe-4S cluster protein (DUF4445 family)